VPKDNYTCQTIEQLGVQPTQVQMSQVGQNCSANGNKGRMKL